MGNEYIESVELSSNFDQRIIFILTLLITHKYNPNDERLWGYLIYWMEQMFKLAMLTFSAGGCDVRFTIKLFDKIVGHIYGPINM